MVRIRRKFVLILSGVTLLIFLVLYIALNYSTSDRANPDLTYLENKIKQLENGMSKHHNEFGDIRKQIDTIRGAVDAGDEAYGEGGKVGLAGLAALELGDREMMKESVINANGGGPGTCPLRADIVPRPDIQMLNLYEEVSFENTDGGAWKQGWSIKYNPSQWNEHHKLNVFVVPHSHNDPGWIQTFAEYYERATKAIFTNMLRHLDENPALRFIWAEISYFAYWYDQLKAEQTEIVKRLVSKGQLEFVTGGWVMADEANSHWYAVLLQLTEGQTWLKTRLNVTPVSSWSIDPFGQSATMPYLLKLSGFENLLIQRTHYIVKKNLAQTKQLEFRWRQLWDTRGDTDLFTHMMPFYSYDVPHTCGPDPKVCCQFDFKRLPHSGVNCPWQVPPRPITEQNVAERAEAIVDQWRKKSVLYRTRNVLVPLGDDFRYTTSSEWEAQRVNYERLFDYINNEPSLNVKARFATLQDYFDAVRASSTTMQPFPSLSGDFFTYCDVNQDYWSGYYTSRPFHKRQDRILLHYVRSADMLHAWSNWEPSSDWTLLEKRLEYARQQLALFQHHDGITGTAKDHVVEDYAQRMARAIEECKFVMQQATYRLLTKPSVYQPDPSFHYLSIDDSRPVSGSDSSRPTIIVGEELPTKQIVLHNSLPQMRSEIVEFYVATPSVMVRDGKGETVVPCQIAPVWSWHTRPDGVSQPQPSNTKFRLLFRATVPPLGMSVYTINFRNSATESTSVTYSKVSILSKTPFTANLAGGYPEDIEFAVPREVSLRVDENSLPGAAFTSKGMLKSITIENNQATIPVHLEFYRYGMQLSSGKSGAYLFHPAGNATRMTYEHPIVLVLRGPLEASVTAGLPFVTHHTILRDNVLEIRNLVDIGRRENTEIIMRLQTNIASGSTFYTDLNAMQMIKRKRFQKLPLQANYYPVPSAMFIEDENYRLTLLSGQPLGGSSLSAGELEIMQDRQLTRDDDRGLGQGVQDNLPVLHLFRLVLEARESCTRPDPDYAAGFLSPAAYGQMHSLLHPLDKLIFNENSWTGVMNEGFGGRHEPLEPGMEIVAMRSLPHVRFGRDEHPRAPPASTTVPIGFVVHRTNFDDCAAEANAEGLLNIKKLLNLAEGHDVFSALLTLLKPQEPLASDDVSFCPMDVKAFIVKR